MRNMLKCASLGIRAIRFSSSGSSVASWNRGSFNRFSPNCRSFCSGEGEEPNSKDDTEITKGKQAEDVKTKEILKELRTYYSGGGKEEHLDSVAQVVMKRALHGNHDESDEELMDKMRFQPVKDVHDSEFESDFSEENDTDHEIDNLYNATEYVEQKIMQDDTVNMSAEQYDEVVKELQDKGYVIDNEGYEQIMEDMLNWNDLLPGVILGVSSNWAEMEKGIAQFVLVIL